MSILCYQDTYDENESSTQKVPGYQPIIVKNIFTFPIKSKYKKYLSLQDRYQEKSDLSDFDYLKLNNSEHEKSTLYSFYFS